VLGERAGVTVVDDYAHHPTEIAAVLAAARQAMPGRRLVAVFQPHLYSRTRDFAESFGAALLAADVALVLPIYAAREAPIPGVCGGIVAEEAKRRGHAAIETVDGMDAALERLEDLLEDGDVLLTLGAGDVHRIAESWLGGRP
jgi:UDP-N-acetylmuramate--alanine ligase